MEADWIRVSDRLPEFDVPVLLTDGKHIHMGQRQRDNYYTAGWKWSSYWCDGYDLEWAFDDRTATHWAPLPSLPKGE